MEKTKADVKGVETQAATSKKGLIGLFSGVGVGAGLAAAGLVAGIAVADKGVEAYEAYGKQIVSVQRLLGDSAEQASTLVGQWQLSHVEVDAGTTGMKFFQKSLYAARDATSAQAKEMKLLGINTKDANGQWLSGDDVLRQVRDKMSGLHDATQRTSLAVALFGRGGASLIPWLEKSNDEIDKQTKFLKDLGLVWSKQDMAKWGTLEEAQAKMQLAMTALEVHIGEVVLPIVNKLIPAFTDLFKVVAAVPTPVWQVVGAIGGILAVMKVATAIGTITKNFKEMFLATKTVTKALEAEKAITKGVAEVDAIAASKTKVLTVAETEEKIATTGTTGALKAGLVTMGLYAIAVAGIMADIYLLVRAYQAWQSAEQAIQQEMQQAKGEVSTGQAAMQKVQAWQAAHPGQALPADYLALQQYAQQAITEGQGNAGRQALKNLPYNLLTGKGWNSLKLAGGGEFTAKRETRLTVGEGGQDEHVTVEPVGKGRSAGHVFDLRGATFVGTSRDAAKHLMRMVNGEMGPRVDALTRGRFADA